jgi:hypothetical protein
MVVIMNPSRRAQTVGPPRDGLHSFARVGSRQGAGKRSLPAAQAMRSADAFSKLADLASFDGEAASGTTSAHAHAQSQPETPASGLPLCRFDALGARSHDRGD